MLSVIFAIFLSLIGCQVMNNKVTENIIRTIDNECDQNNTCTVSMKDITDFDWDRMVVFGLGSSNSEISEALGVEYRELRDLMSGMVFVYNNKIVYQEMIDYDPERPSKLRIIIEHKTGEPNCAGFTPDTAVFKSSKNNIDEVYYYQIIAVRE